MIIFEGVLIVLVVLLCLFTSYTDITKGIIYNRHIVKYLILFVALDIVYYGFFAREYAAPFLINALLMVILSFILFYGNIWAGGDCKLFITLIFGIPANIYNGIELGPAPGFMILLIVFSIAFIQIVTESIFYSIRDKEKIRVRLNKVRASDLAVGFLLVLGIMQLINIALSYFVRYMQISGTLFILMANFICILGINSIYDRVSQKNKIVLACIVWVCLLIYSFMTHSIQLGGFYWKSWILVIAIFLLRTIADQYNYQEIETDKVAANMILSAATVFGFSGSRIKGLPINMKEDLSARLSASEADAVRRWGKSSKGLKTVTIVRKVPFALFISIGTVLFLLIEGVFLWHII